MILSLVRLLAALDDIVGCVVFFTTIAVVVKKTTQENCLHI